MDERLMDFFRAFSTDEEENKTLTNEMLEKYPVLKVIKNEPSKATLIDLLEGLVESLELQETHGIPIHFDLAKEIKTGGFLLYYCSHLIVYKDKKAVVYPFLPRTPKLEFDGTDVTDTLLGIKDLIDTFIYQNKETLIEHIKNRHKRALEKIGISDVEVGSIQDPFRKSHCFRCKRPISNVFDLECFSCGWIICPSEGYCGCIYDKTKFHNIRRHFNR